MLGSWTALNVVGCPRTAGSGDHVKSAGAADAAGAAASSAPVAAMVSSTQRRALHPTRAGLFTGRDRLGLHRRGRVALRPPCGCPVRLGVRAAPLAPRQ